MSEGLYRYIVFLVSKARFQCWYFSDNFWYGLIKRLQSKWTTVSHSPPEDLPCIWD
jgi:hypothetical protein